MAVTSGSSSDVRVMLELIERLQERIAELEREIAKLLDDAELQNYTSENRRPVCCPECRSTNYRCAVCHAEW
jgi:uncharacterized protein (UPF0335 family)